jgi:membrane protein
VGGILFVTMLFFSALAFTILENALIGGVTATLLWEMMRHILAWYYTTMSQIQLVYGSLTTAIAVLLSVEIGALVLLVGAQVIAEYERISREPIETSGHSLKLESPVESKP